MNSRTVNIKYGVKLGFHKGNQRWFVTLDQKTTGLHYAKKDFALKKSKNFAENCYSPFTDFQGKKVNFTFQLEG